MDEAKVRAAQVAQPGTRRVVIRNSAAPQPNVTRKVIVARPGVVQKQPQKVIVKTQGSERIVVQKSAVQMKKAAEIKSSTVKIENLAAGTTELQIRRMCQAVGTIEVTIFT